MKELQRRATIAVALSLGALSAPAALAAQTTRAPGPDTPRLLVAVFTSDTRPLGVQAADAIRSRIQSAVNIRTLYVIPREHITTYLESSGYKPDSALGPSDLRELSKLLRADEVLFGSVTSTAGGVRIEPRLALARDPSIAQPLPAVEVREPDDAARAIERSLQDARRQLVDVRACENAIRDQQHARAIAAARAGITKYADATLARLCLANAFQAMKAPPDSVLRVVDEIRKLDPKNSAVFRFAYLAHTEKGDAESAVRSLVQWLELEPTNITLRDQVITELGKLGKPSVALPIVNDMLSQNPGDPQLLRQKWLLSLATAATDTVSASRMAMLDTAITAGQSMVRIDTTLSDSVYFSRQIAAASAMTTQPQKAVEIASRAVQKFPSIAEFWVSKGNAERKAGQLQMAQQSLSRALTLDSKYPNANLLLAQVFVEMNQVDSAVAVARRGVAAGEDARTWGTFLLGPTQTVFKYADSTKVMADYERALALAQESDKLAPSAAAKFFRGVSSFSIGMQAMQDAQKPKSCELARKAQNMLLETMTNMPAGGSIDAGTAQTVLGYVSQYAPTADQMVKAYCK